MKKILTLLLLLGSFLYSCPMCKMEVPMVAVKSKVISKDNKTEFHITWEFNKSFVSTLTMYDENKNGKIDESEQKLIKETLEVYLKDNNYLTIIQLCDKNKEPDDKNDLKIVAFNKQMKIIKDHMYYKYSFKGDFSLKKDSYLFMKFFDKNYSFNFMMKEVKIDGFEGYKKVIKKEDVATVNFFEGNNTIVKKEIKASVVEYVDEPEELTMMEEFSERLRELKDKLEQTLQNIKDSNSISSYIWLLLFSLGYGILHAIGPGHGKSLVSAYFLANDNSYIKAMSVSTLIGLVHTFSAFILTYVIYYVLNSIFASYFTKIEDMAIKVSAVVIIIIALYLLNKKIKARKNHHNHAHTSCGCGSCSTKSTDIGVILGAGLVPCPGTVTIFIFCLSLDMVFVGFLSAIFMSIGMSIIIFVAAMLSIKVRKQTHSNEKLIKFFEYASLFFILGLGLVLLIS